MTALYTAQLEIVPYLRGGGGGGGYLIYCFQASPQLTSKRPTAPGDTLSFRGPNKGRFVW